jgi:hypothetical protein
VGRTVEMMFLSLDWIYVIASLSSHSIKIENDEIKI